MSVRNAKRIGRGSIAGNLTPRKDTSPGLRGSIALEEDIAIKAGKHLHLVGWLRIEPATGVPFISLVLEIDERGRS